MQSTAAHRCDGLLLAALVFVCVLGFASPPLVDLADKDGLPLTSDHEALLFGARILNDTRIGPGEERSLRFTFDVSQGQKRSKVTATLSYRYSPVILREQRVDIRMGTAERIVY